MQEYPGIQKQAHEELDAVVGRDRLPSFSDQQDLPYLEALCKELLRYEPPVPAGTLLSLICLSLSPNRDFSTSAPANRG